MYFMGPSKLGFDQHQESASWAAPHTHHPLMGWSDHEIILLAFSVIKPLVL